MRIVFVVDWFSERMGYAENALPPALAALGHEVHIVTSDLQTYFNSPSYAQTYEPFIGPAVVACGRRPYRGCELHRLPHAMVGRSWRIRGLRAQVRELRPDIVQCFDAASLPTLEMAWLRRAAGFRLFLGSHVHESVFRGRRAVSRWRWRAHALSTGRFVSSRTERCYAISEDAARIATHSFGIEAARVVVSPLGVDTELFAPPAPGSGEEAARRLALGFAPDELVCVYSGRFSPDKDPLCLARAVDALARAGRRVRGLFIGAGTDAEAAAIRASAGCLLHPFVAPDALPGLYRAADIGVWPRQESTSQLDAAACGLPLILSDRVSVRERVEGSGRLYSEGDHADLARAILSLEDPATRRAMGAAGARRVRENWSWSRIARDRIVDYGRALAHG